MMIESKLYDEDCKNQNKDDYNSSGARTKCALLANFPSRRTCEPTKRKII